MDSSILENLLEITRQMSETRTLDPLLSMAMSRALNLIGAQRGYLVLLNDNGTLDFRVKLDRDGHELINPEEQVSYSILNQVISTHQSLVLTDAMDDPTFQNSLSVIGLQLRSVMCVPLISRQKAIGAIFVENRASANVFRTDDLKPLTFFASQAAVAIENAMLNDELEQRVAERTAELEDAMIKLEKSWMDAVEANRVRTLLVTNITHDLRSPLSLALGALSMLEAGEFGEMTSEQYTWIAKSLETLKHVVRLTDDFFDLTRIEAGKLNINPVPVEMTPYLQEIYAVGEGLPWAEAVRFESDIPDNLPVLNIDPTRIQQVVFNLLSNAQKFTDRGFVRLYARMLDDVLLVGVQDTGTGLAPHEIEKIYEPYVQAETTSAKHSLGSGLGLAIARELVEIHGGSIRAESVPGKGSDFKFTLPLYSPA